MAADTLPNEIGRLPCTDTLDAGTDTSPTPPQMPGVTAAVLGWDALNGMDIPRREKLMGDWLRAGDYGVIYGARGSGKSWLSLAAAGALAQGRPLGAWNCQTPRRVLYIDGEMSLDDLRDRVRTLKAGCGNFFTLSHQVVFDKSKTELCLSEIAQQAAVIRHCEENKIDVLFLDNGACLFRGVAENDADDFRDKVENWLLDLRRRGIAVILVLHAGRNGAIRGTSKREDAASWIIRLEGLPGGRDNSLGAHFLTRFSKNRNSPADPPPLEWGFVPCGQETAINCREADAMAVFKQWIEDGLATCSEIAEEMGLSKGQVSKMAKRAEREGWLVKQGKEYRIK